MNTWSWTCRPCHSRCKAGSQQSAIYAKLTQCSATPWAAMAPLCCHHMWRVHAPCSTLTATGWCCVPADHKTEILETIEGTAIYSPSVMQHVQGLVIPGGQESYTANYSCSRRCTYVPLGGLLPQPVKLAGYTFHGHHFMTGVLYA